MDYKELVKKYWFVGVLAIALIIFIGIYAADVVKNQEPTVPSKQVDSKYVVYSVDGENVFADDFYDSLYAENGLSCAFIAFQRAVLDGAYETTEEMNNIATNYAAYMYQTYGEDYVMTQLKAMGYTNGPNDLIQYYIDAQKSNLLITDYLKAHQADVVNPYIEEQTPRIIYHILIKLANVEISADKDGNQTYIAKPTEEETQKLNDVLEALKTMSFQEVAQMYSDDSSATNGGYIGVISLENQSNYYPVFSKKSLELASGEVSEPIVSSAGYHIIWNAGSTAEELLKDEQFISSIQEHSPQISMKAVLEKADELGYKIVDEQLQTLIDSQLVESEDAE